MSRDQILHKVRTALGRSAGQEPPPQPPLRLLPSEPWNLGRVATFLEKLHELAGKGYHAASPEEACAYVAGLLRNRTAVISADPLLEQCGINRLAQVRPAVEDLEELHTQCAAADIGITGADFALADTGTLVMLASRKQPRLVSLLPPIHVAVVSAAKILSGLDELLTLLPLPNEHTSSMVLITGPSRTADIEQILVRGVHGPGEIHVIVIP